MNDKKYSGDLVHQLKDVLDSVMGGDGIDNYPPESLPMGTYVKANKYDRLGVIVDAFYGDVDKDGKKIIIYTVLMFPDNKVFTTSYSNSTQFYISNEYEYEVTAYLMISPINIKNMSHVLGGNFLL